MEEKNEQKIKSIKEKISRPPTLNIARIPPRTLKRFKTIANYEDFCGDYGMALKYLIDFHDGIIPAGIEHLELEIQRLNEKINKFEELLEKKEEKPKKNRLR